MQTIAIDVETTGMSPSLGHRIIEIGAVQVTDGVLGREFHSLINCRRAISAGAMRVHGITQAMLEDQPQPQTAFNAFRDFIGTTPLVAHNAVFDLRFLRHEFGRLGWGLNNRIYCTYKISRKQLPLIPNYRLETVARHLLGDLPADTHLHRALDDARLVARVWTAFQGA